jgi:phosphoglycolate phosphatase-like HAD superfamily hydrolase
MLTIVFDLDGTLIDTAPDLIDALNFTLAGHALPTVPYAQARSLIGGGAWGMIERALTLEGRTAATADVDTLYASFVAHYGEHIADRSRPFPELEPVLERLAQAGHRFARSAPTSSKRCRSVSLTLCSSATALRPSAVRTRLGSTSPIRRCSAPRS